MFGEDLYTVGRMKAASYGVYYHACFWTRGPHLTEGCDPEKMAFCYRDAAKYQNVCYSILNVSNVRPVHLSAALNARILMSPTTYDAASAMLEFDRSIFGDAAGAVCALRRAYYACFADFGEIPLRSMAKNKSFYYHPHENLPFIRNAATDGQLAYFGKYTLDGKKDPRFPENCRETKQLLIESERKFEALLAETERVEAGMGGSTRQYFEAFLKYQIKHMMLLTRWCIGCMELTDASLPHPARLASGARACASLEEILTSRRVLERGEWEHWHRGDKKINISGLLDLTRKVMNGVKI